ncbi:MAG: hypothetical protein JSU64_07425 [candidate division WOR-3 bacterium]|nr:MAG: hypothetical protein JSU64_07425 [candidate division WOR-3 bacterium]
MSRNITAAVERHLPGLFVLLILLATTTIYAQQTAQIKGILRIPDSLHTQILEMHDGSVFIGRIVEITDNEVQFESKVGLINIEIAQIKEIKEVPVTSFKQGQYWFPNPNDTRLLFAPTGRSLKGGTGYFADYYLFFPMLAYGITDNVTVAGGMSLIPGLSQQLLYFTPKFGMTAKNVSIGIGSLVAALPGEDLPTVGIMYGVGTLGSADNNFTVGLGLGFVDWEFSGDPFLMAGGQLRVSRRVSLVSENWVFPGLDEPFLSGGIRFFGERISVDLALIIPVGIDIDFPFIPYIDFVITF